MTAEMENMKRNEWVILILCLIIGFSLRFYAFDQKSLWMDEIHTFNDSRDGLMGQIRYYQENPTYLHPPLFFVLTHLFHPFAFPERELRIIPLIFGTLSIPMIFFLSRLFSPGIALSCAVSLTFMAYHTSLSQDGRAYSFLMFLGMSGLFFFMRYLTSSNRWNLLGVALSFAGLFHTSYSSIPFIALSQILWFYQANGRNKRFDLRSFILLNGLILLLCMPWILFLLFHKKQPLMIGPSHTEDPGTFWTILYGILHDWVPYFPLMITSAMLLIFFPFFSQKKKNAIVLLAIFLLPIGGLYLFCELLRITHFITSRYFINFLPLFLISIFLCLLGIEMRFERMRRFLRPRLLFVVLFIASNLVILPLYYRSEKQDFRRLVTYLKAHVREGDKIFVESTGYMPGILHYFGNYPKGRHQTSFAVKYSEKENDIQVPFTYMGSSFTLYCSKACCTRYVADGNRLWIIVGKWTASKIRENSPCVLKGFFDGSFLNFNRFPQDASIYLFLWDPHSPGEKGIDIPIQ